MYDILQPPPTVELNGVCVDDFLPSPPTTVKLNGELVDDSIPPPPTLRVELNRLHGDY